MVWGSVSVCQRRITFLSAAWAELVRSSRAAVTVAASKRVLIVEPSLVGKRPESRTFCAGRQARERGTATPVLRVKLRGPALHSAPRPLRQEELGHSRTGPAIAQSVETKLATNAATN